MCTRKVNYPDRDLMYCRGVNQSAAGFNLYKLDGHKFAAGRYLIVVAGGFALSVEETSPVAGLESFLQVSVNKYFDILSLCSDGECGDSLWGGKVAKDKRAKNWGERAPVADNVTGLKTESTLVKRADYGGSFSESVETDLNISY